MNNSISNTSSNNTIIAEPGETLNLYLEDLFDLFCTYQDETHRYLALVFYILPSRKVK